MDLCWANLAWLLCIDYNGTNRSEKEGTKLENRLVFVEYKEAFGSVWGIELWQIMEKRGHGKQYEQY